jgi:hypothetical protein
MNYENSYSLSDIAAATGNNGRNSDGMFGDGNGAWFIILFLIFAVFGWGRNGNGFGGGTGSVSDNYVLASDFATLQRQIDSSTATLERKSDTIQQGLCDGFYAMNTGMLNGFSGVQQTLCQGFSGVNQAIATNGYETRLGTQALGSQLASCCCNIEKAVQGVNYNMAMNTNTLQNAMCLNTRDLIENQNNGTRAILDALTANRIEDKNAQIQAQQNEINALRLAASQEKQNSFLISQLNPTPVPSYPVANPNCCLNYQVTNGCCGCGCN